jgi:hypothetical protein
VSPDGIEKCEQCTELRQVLSEKGDGYEGSEKQVLETMTMDDLYSNIRFEYIRGRRGGADLIISTTSPKNVGKLQINPPMILAGKWANYAIRRLQRNRKARPGHYTWINVLLVRGMPTMCQMELKTSWKK